MLRLKPRQRVALSETVRDLANLVAGALVLSQFVGQEPLSWQLILAGIASWVVMVSIALVLVREKQW
jgi:hypothetical protein